jgi:hypothetical protein
MAHDLTLQDFDKEDLKNLGRPYYFDVDMFLACVEQMISSDEVERALWMLDNMPGWYRDNPPPQAKQIRDQLLKRLYTTMDYIKDCDHPHQTQALIGAAAGVVERGFAKIGRAQAVRMIIDKLKSPYIFDLAPGSYWLPILLKKCGYDFKYFGESLNKSQQAMAKDYLSNEWHQGPHPGPSVFICFELIEHLHSTTEIYQHYLKAELNCDYIILSTPKYTIAGASPEWHKQDLGHLRTYTPSEFVQFAMKHWPKHKWEYFDSATMVLVGKKID